MNARTIDRRDANEARVATEQAAKLAKRRSLATVPFRRLPFAARRELAIAARAAHPQNHEHRARWIRSRRLLDVRGLTPMVAIGRGQTPARTITEMRQWERAARMVC